MLKENFPEPNEIEQTQWLIFSNLSRYIELTNEEEAARYVNQIFEEKRKKDATD